MKCFVLSLLLLAYSPFSHASFDCSSGVPVGGHIGIPVEYIPEEERKYAKPTVYELILAQIAWLPYDEELRYRYQEVIDIDWQSQSITQVDLYDGALPGIVETGIREAELVASSDFFTGHLDVHFCMSDIYRSRGLIFAHYGTEGAILETQVVPFSWAQISGGIRFSAVVNEFLSDAIVDTFNDIIVSNVTNDVERSTGVLPGRYLAESLIQQNLSSTTDLVFRDQALLFGGHDTLVFGNQVVITGDEPSVSAVHSVNGVYSNEIPIMDAGYLVSDLDLYVGPISIEANGVRRTAIIVDGRADFDAQVSECVNGLRQISVHTNHPSELEGGVTLRGMDGSPLPEVLSDHRSISTEMPCDTGFLVESSRAIFLQGGSSRWDYVYGHDTKPLTVDEDQALFDPAYTLPYRTDLHYLTEGVVINIQDVDPQLIKTIWGIDDLALLKNGLNYYTCTPAGDTTVDSIDEIAANAFARLTPDELLDLQMLVPPNYEVHPMFDDSDGDGSICNGGERPVDGPENQLGQIWLRVSRFLNSAQ